jgi:hypothetical protein
MGSSEYPTTEPLKLEESNSLPLVSKPMVCTTNRLGPKLRAYCPDDASIQEFQVRHPLTCCSMYSVRHY